MANQSLMYRLPIRETPTSRFDHPREETPFALVKAAAGFGAAAGVGLLIKVASNTAAARFASVMDAAAVTPKPPFEAFGRFALWLVIGD